MLVGNIDPADSNVREVVRIYVTTGYIIPTALLGDKLSTGL